MRTPKAVLAERTTDARRLLALVDAEITRLEGLDTPDWGDVSDAGYVTDLLARAARTSD